jgi:hypothetical protein
LEKFDVHRRRRHDTAPNVPSPRQRRAICGDPSKYSLLNAFGRYRDLEAHARLDRFIRLVLSEWLQLYPIG